jgi:hypothetical protein
MSMNQFRNFVEEAQAWHDFSSRMFLSVDNMGKVRVVSDTPGGWPRLTTFEYKEVVDYAADWPSIMRRLHLPELKVRNWLTEREIKMRQKTALKTLSDWTGR